ncbi:hypothetical protein VF10_25070, partial [Nostoc linckia z13]
EEDIKVYSEVKTSSLPVMVVGGGAIACVAFAAGSFWSGRRKSRFILVDNSRLDIPVHEEQGLQRRRDDFFHAEAPRRREDEEF